MHAGRARTRSRSLARVRHAPHPRAPRPAPASDCPFYRCTIFSHYAPGNTPPEGTLLPTLCTPAAASAGTARAAAAAEAGPYWSLMFEVSESDEKPVDSRPVSIGDREVPAVVLDTIRGAVSTRLLQANSEIVSLFHCRLERGYPVPSLSRDAALANALPYLQERGIWSRGRFGAWKYEVANQDHSCMQVRRAAAVCPLLPALTPAATDGAGRRGRRQHSAGHHGVHAAVPGPRQLSRAVQGHAVQAAALSVGGPGLSRPSLLSADAHARTTTTDCDDLSCGAVGRGDLSHTHDESYVVALQQDATCVAAVARVSGVQAATAARPRAAPTHPATAASSS